VKAYVSQRLKALDLTKRPEVTWTITPVTPPNVPFDLPNAKTWQDLTLSYQSILDERYTPNPVVRVVITDNKGIKRVTGMQIKIQATARVWAASTPLNAGERLKSSHLKLVPADISRQLELVLTEATSPLALHQYEARVMIRAGELLDLRKIRKIPDVARNSPVRLVIEASPGVQVGVSGIALQDGNIGDTIRIKREKDDHSRHYMTGVVIDKHRVKVDP
jgi:flagella basal body P-ring formation protein FlgA